MKEDTEGFSDQEEKKASAGIEDMPLWLALIPVLFLVASLGVTVVFYKMSMPHQALVCSTAVAVITARIRGVKWSDSLDGMIGSVTMALPACLILMVVGILIGTWILAGVVPSLIVYGLKLMSPRFFLAATCVVCSVISLATGSSWSTAGTVGVALMGVGGGLGIPPAMTAGAIISGAYFGDKLSPLSDTTNLAPAVSGTDLFTHIKHMLYTTIPSFVIAVSLYLGIGLFLKVGHTGAEDVKVVIEVLSEHHMIHPVMLLAPAAVIGMVVLKTPALPALFIGSLIGAVFAWVFQDKGLKEILAVAQGGFVSKTGVSAVDGLLNRGGLESMMNTVALIICALSFGGVMERGGMLQRISIAVLSLVKGVGSLVAATLLSCIGMNVLGGEQYMAIVIPGRMYRPAFKKMGLHSKNLSRCLEDGGTVTSALVPWNSGGAYMFATLGISPIFYLPYAFLNILTPMMSLFYGVTGLTMERIEESEPDNEPSVSAESSDQKGSR